MRILFVHAENENLGVQYLSAVLKESGHDVKLVFDPCLFKDSFVSNEMLHKTFDYKRIILKQAIDYKPDLVAFSVLSARYRWACETAKELKKFISVPFIFGGIHPTLVPEVVLNNDFVDMVCMGEGEEAFLELVESISKKKKNHKIKNIWYKKDGHIIKNPIRPLLRDLDSLPCPDRRIYEFEVSPGRYLIMASRGCINSCSYCYNSYYKKAYKGEQYLRLRSVDSVIKELALAKKEYNPKYVIFHDDVFGFKLSWLKEFNKKYKRHINLPFYCSLHPSYITEEHLRLLDDCKCVLVNMGIQTTDENYAKSVLNRPNSNKKLVEVIDLFKKTNIWLMTDIMIGLPRQTEEDLFRMAEFFSENHSDQIACYWLIYYPKMDILYKAQEMGVITEKDAKDITNSRTFTSYGLGGTFFKKEFTPELNLITLAHILPKSVTKFLIKNKRYKWLLGFNIPYVLNSTLYNISAFFRGKKRLNVIYGRGGYVRYYLHYMRCFLKFKLKR